MQSSYEASGSARRIAVTGLLFLAIFIAYMDRVNFSVAIPAIQKDYGFSLRQIGDITFAWSIVYALFNFPGGWIADRLGLRWGLPIALGWWSIFTIASPFAGGITGWLLLRGLMGAGEAPIWSFMAKAADDWGADGRRSTIYGVAGSGEFLGPALGALLAGWIATHLDWRWSFILFGAAGMLLLPFWFWLVRDRPDGSVEDKSVVDWVSIRDMLLSRTGIGLMATFTANGYVLFTFKNWVPTYMHAVFNSSLFGGAAWSSVSAGLGFIGFLLAGPVNDWLVSRMDRLTARRVGTAIPAILAIGCMLAAVRAADVQAIWANAVLIGLAQFLCTITAGAWAVSVIDLAPNRASTGVLFGIFNGALNLCGAFNALLITWIASKFGFNMAFASVVLFMAVFAGAMALIVDRRSYERLLASAESARSSGDIQSS